MAAFAVLIGSVVLFFVLISSANGLFDTASKQTWWCLFPPIALQIGVLAKFNCEYVCAHRAIDPLTATTCLPAPA